MNEAMPQTQDSATTVEKEKSYAAILRILSYSKVSFVRYLAVDPYGSIRCKAVSIDHLRKSGTLEFQAVSSARVNVNRFQPQISLSHLVSFTRLLPIFVLVAFLRFPMLLFQLRA